MRTVIFFGCIIIAHAINPEALTDVSTPLALIIIFSVVIMLIMDGIEFFMGVSE